MAEPVVDKEDVRTIQFLLADILKAVTRLVELMEDDDGQEEGAE